LIQLFLIAYLPILARCKIKGAVGAVCVLLRIWPLKGLSHEIDFKNLDKKFTELGLTKGRGWFLNFLGASMIL
jgi:hypothetical protein